MTTASATPQVTVLLPVLNGAAYLKESIDSILGQTFTNFELLVIDDGSTDATPQILRSIRDPRLRVVTHPQNLGFVATLKEGLETACGALIARQDHDDISFPERLRKQVEFLRRHPDYVLVGAEAWQTDAHGRRAFRLLRPTDPESIRWYLCFDNAFIHSSVLYRRDVIREKFDETLPPFPTDDYALWSRIAALHPTANLPEPLLHYREHGTSATSAMSPARQAAFAEATRPIREENLRTVFRDRAHSNDAAILTDYRRDFSPASATKFLAVFDRLVAIRAAEIQDVRGFRRVRAVQLAELAYRLLPFARGPALVLYRRALTLHPALLPLLPWLRIAALLLFGENARAIYLKFFGRS